MNAKELAQKYPYKCGAALLSLVLLGFGIYRHYDLPSLEEEQERLTKQAATSHSNVVNSASLEAQLETLRAANKQATERMAGATDLAGNTQYFYRVEGETGVREITLSPITQRGSTTPKGAYYKTTSFNLAVEGKFGQILNLLDRLEGGAWFGRVSTLTIRHAGNTDTRAEPQLVATLTVDLIAAP